MFTIQGNTKSKYSFNEKVFSEHTLNVTQKSSNKYNYPMQRQVARNIFQQIKTQQQMFTVYKKTFFCACAIYSYDLIYLNRNMLRFLRAEQAWPNILSMI